MSKRVLVAGGASGMGAATVQQLLLLQHEVVVLDVIEPSAGIGFRYCNLADPLSIAEVAAAEAEPIWALINAAGVATAADPLDTVAINFLGLRELTEQLLPRIQPGGSVVNVASTAGRRWQEHAARIEALLLTDDYPSGLAWLQTHRDYWESEPYQFAKRCTAAYTYRATKIALARGIRVNCVHPGVVTTRLSGEFRELVGPDLYDWGVAQVGRPGNVKDIAEVLTYLAVGDCRWLNGVELVVDGGYVAGVIGGWIDPTQAP